MAECEVFGAYADVYDALYSDKDYVGECEAINQVLSRHGEFKIHSILDMGCGTGGHAIPLAVRGYQVVGIDRSPEMIARASGKAVDVPDAGQRPRFAVADIRTASLGREFDAAICMFAVLGYQTTNEDVLASLRTARQHLRRGGLFICDFWYGPAVLSQRPGDRAKEVVCGEDRVVRLAHPRLDSEANTVTVEYHVLRLRDTRLMGEARETHVMRFFFRPELASFLSQSGFRLTDVKPFPSMDRAVSEDTWNVAAVAIAE